MSVDSTCNFTMISGSFLLIRSSTYIKQSALLFWDFLSPFNLNFCNACADLKKERECDPLSPKFAKMSLNIELFTCMTFHTSHTPQHTRNPRLPKKNFELHIKKYKKIIQSCLEGIERILKNVSPIILHVYQLQWWQDL